LVGENKEDSKILSGIGRYIGIGLKKSISVDL